MVRHTQGESSQKGQSEQRELRLQNAQRQETRTFLGQFKFGNQYLLIQFALRGTCGPCFLI